jgi:hypothetical protein
MTKARAAAVLVQVDARNRVSLGNLAEHAQYLARSTPDGTIIFEPAEVVTIAERTFLSDPQLVVALAKVNASPGLRSHRKRRPLATA